MQRVVDPVRIRDRGLWFDTGVRVVYHPAALAGREPRLEKGALGSYEVLECQRVTADDTAWLEVRLRRLF